MVREGLKQLHIAAVRGELAEAGLQQRVQEAIRCLAAAAGGGQQAAAGGTEQQQGQIALAAEGQVEELPGGSGSSSKRQRVGLEDSGEAMTIDELPCNVCGNSDGSDMLCCDSCGSGAGHLGCLGLAEVPEGVWCCSSKCEKHRGDAQAAADLHGRWVLGKFQGVEGDFWGQLSYVSYGVLNVRYVDAELYEGVRVSHVLGQERLVGHHGLLLQPQGCTVPPKVLRVFRDKGWLV